jgi:hypothetical protein
MLHACYPARSMAYPREGVPTNQTHWADEDVASSEFFGVPVGELIECR